MMIVSGVVLLVLSGVLFDATYGQSGCNVCGRPKSQYYAGTGKCYYLIDDDSLQRPWQVANQYCMNQGEGGQLAIVDELSITEILIEITEDCGHDEGRFDAWIGLSSNAQSEWYWLQGNDQFHTKLVVPPDYQNFPGGLPGNRPNRCGCFATPDIVPQIGQWFAADCNTPQYFFCEIPYVSPCTWPQQSIHCPETSSCYCLWQQPMRDWDDARAACQGGAPGGDLATPKTLDLSRALRNLVHQFAESSWDAWIGLFSNAGGWQWVDGEIVTAGDFHLFDPAFPAAGDVGCVAMFGPDGYWYFQNCDLLKWFFCQSDEYTSACCDPHFMVKPKGIKDHVCFDYYGEDKDVLQLIYSEKYNLAVNSEVFSHPHTKKTWFRALSLIAPGCAIVAYTKGIHVNDKLVEWIDIEDQPCGSSGVTYSIKDDLHRPSTHLIIRVMPGLELIFSKDQKTYKFGTVEYMDFDMTKHYALDETTDGILGEFMGMRVSLDEDSVSNDTDTGILYFPDEPGHGSVIAHRVSRKNLLTNKHFHCWNVEDEGAGLVRGKARDYLVPDLHTGQRAQSLHQSEDEGAGAIF